MLFKDYTQLNQTELEEEVKRVAKKDIEVLNYTYQMLKTNIEAVLTHPGDTAEADLTVSVAQLAVISQAILYKCIGEDE